MRDLRADLERRNASRQTLAAVDAAANAFRRAHTRYRKHPVQEHPRPRTSFTVGYRAAHRGCDRPSAECPFGREIVHD